MTTIPIKPLVEGIKVMLSKGRGRFTADEVEILENALKVLNNLELLPIDKRKDATAQIVIQFFRVFLYHELFREIEHFLSLN